MEIGETSTTVAAIIAQRGLWQTGPTDPIPERMVGKIIASITDMAHRYGLEITLALQAVIDYAPNAYVRSSPKTRNLYATDRRGLMLCGDPGTGKTIALELLARCTGMIVLTTDKMLETFLEGEDHAFVRRARELAPSPIVIDDLGSERDATSYGNASPIPGWLQSRYHDWQHGGPEMHIATNLSQSAIATRYGARVLDRLRECCIIVPISGASMRQSKKWTDK